MSRTSLLGLLDRVPSPSVDLSYNIHPGDNIDALEKFSDLLVTVGVYKPAAIPQIDLCTQVLNEFVLICARLVSPPNYVTETRLVSFAKSGSTERCRSLPTGQGKSST